MVVPLSPTVAVLVFGIIVLGGVVTGVNGFGYSVVGTGLLALASGLVFGASNVGVQVIAYLESLDHRTFVGVVAMVFVGISSVRVVAAGVLGLYDSGLLLLSAGAAVPGLTGVALGKRIRPRLSRSTRRTAMFLLLAFVGVRLVKSGLGL